jgi:predicted deacylase
VPVPDRLIQLPDSDDEAASRLRGRRIGLPREYFVDGMEPGVEARVREAVEALQAAGAIVEDVSLPHTDYGLATYYIVAPADYGIDLHTGAIDRTNLPQIRANLRDPKVRQLAEAFGSPVIIDSSLRDGSLRRYAAEQGVPVIVYEAGEALRFDEVSIGAGVRGITRVLRLLGMLPESKQPRTRRQSMCANTTTWVRSPGSGMFRSACHLGARVSQGQVLGQVADPFGEFVEEITAPGSGLIIGRSTSPLAHEGDALFHIARFDDNREAQATFDEFQEAHSVETTWG